ncbi:MAG: BTAD domain-containing putative transcriptional regulator [Myxococcota bacterium]
MSGWSKIGAPYFADICARPRLFRLLDAQPRCRARFVSAPAGSGKTCLVGSYLAQSERRAVWFSLDASDALLSNFFFYLRRAAQAVVGSASERLPTLGPEYQQGLSTFSRRYFELLFELLPGDAAIVLDNYETIPEDSLLHALIASAIESTPPGIDWFVASRLPLPKAFARLRLDALIELSWDDVRLTLDETEALCRARRRRAPLSTRDRSSGPQADDAATLQELSQGWAAGIVLLMERRGPPASVDSPSVLDRCEPVFDYFAAEVFERLSAEQREVLMKTAVLPQIDPAIGKRLTGVAAADRILGEMVEKNYFVMRHGSRRSALCYHPLFRQFLLGRAADHYSPEALQSLRSQAGRLLEAAGQFEHAAELLCEAEDWSRLADLVIRCADELIAQGRHELVARWLSRVPEDHAAERYAWVLFWLANARLPLAPDDAITLFARAFHLFLEQPEPHEPRAIEGLFLSWAGVIEATLFSWTSIAHLDYWIDILDTLLLRFRPPSLRVEARVIALIHGALIFRRRSDPALPVWDKKLRRFLLAARLLDVNQFILLTNNLFVHDLWLGQVARAMGLLASLRRAAHSKRVQPMSLNCWHTMRAVSGLFTGDYEETLVATEQGLETSRSSGVHFWDPILLSQGAFASVSLGRLDECAEYLSRMRGLVSADQFNSAGLFHDASAQLALAREEFAEALEHSREAVASAMALGAAFPEAGCRVGLAHALCALGRTELARSEMVTVLAAAREMKAVGLEARALLGLAHIEFEAGADDAGEAALRQGLGLSREHGYWTHIWWTSKVMARLCARALAAGIESQFVRELIQRRRLSPPSRRRLEPHWPVALSVTTLGTKRVLLEERALDVSQRAQLRPLELLHALIAFGGNGVSEARLAEALWPDSDGDAANQALATTLHRLRRVIGSDVIVRSERCLGLNPSSCWVDSLACDSAWSELEQLSLPELVASLDLYKGPFLGDDVEASWMVVFRERLRSKYVRAVGECSRRFEQAGEHDRAIFVYERALDIEPAVEVLYRELIRLLSTIGRHAEAAHVYERCRRTLRATLDVDPSSETSDLARAQPSR